MGPQQCHYAERMFNITTAHMQQVQARGTRTRLQVGNGASVLVRVGWCCGCCSSRHASLPALLQGSTHCCQHTNMPTARQPLSPPPCCSPAPLPPALQVSCLQIDDSVAFRQHWPLQADLRINSNTYRVTARGGGTKLGANQRDEAASITNLVMPGRNKLQLSCADNRQFMFSIQVRPRRGAEPLVCTAGRNLC